MKFELTSIVYPFFLIKKKIKEDKLRKNKNIQNKLILIFISIINIGVLIYCILLFKN